MGQRRGSRTGSHWLKGHQTEEERIRIRSWPRTEACRRLSAVFSLESELTEHPCPFRIEDFVMKSCRRKVRLELVLCIFSESRNLSSPDI